MPTKKKRVGFIPREDVMKIVCKLSVENNLSNSKIISILVEEALSIRGLFNKKNGKEIKSFKELNEYSQNLTGDSTDFRDNKKLRINTKYGKNLNLEKTTAVKQTNKETFDFQTYKKFLSFLKFQEMIDEYDN
tara:strand:+ start:64 stop:462 length:399 start_codon:yes stop_codon:yes gene_type:complete